MSSMNIFRVTGDLLHLFAIIFILLKIIKSKSCGGISGRTECLFLLTYLVRYSDLFTDFETEALYMVIYKIAYVALHCMIIVTFVIFRKTYSSADDKFMTELLVIPCFLLALFLNHTMSAIEVLYTFGVYLESVAIIPQLYMIYRKRQIEKSILIYLTLLGIYKSFYGLNWIYRYLDSGHCDMVLIVAGIVYISVYLLAFVSFCWMRVEVIKDGHFLKENIFFISSNDPGSEHGYEDTNSDKEKILQTI